MEYPSSWRAQNKEQIINRKKNDSMQIRMTRKKNRMRSKRSSESMHIKFILTFSAAEPESFTSSSWVIAGVKPIIRIRCWITLALRDGGADVCIGRGGKLANLLSPLRGEAGTGITTSKSNNPVLLTRL